MAKSGRCASISVPIASRIERQLHPVRLPSVHVKSLAVSRLLIFESKPLEV